MTDLDPVALITGIRFAMSRGDGPERPADYLVVNTSERVVNFILPTAFQHEFWSGLRWPSSSRGRPFSAPRQQS
ncbi:MAG: hypothetical protein H6524_02855 [Actinobacteria bacterium]|nr:hypothetical protein [Actinomycetota bacterium]